AFAGGCNAGPRRHDPWIGRPRRRPARCCSRSACTALRPACRSDGGRSRPLVGIAAIVPARNESARIGATVKALGAIGEITETIVVDDASTDQTAECARDAGAHVVRLPTRRGKGGALQAGLERTAADVLVFIDGDLGGTAGIARVLLEPVVADEADMTIAAPAPGPTSGFGLVESVSRAGIRALTGIRLTRPLSGQRALRRDVA